MFRLAFLFVLGRSLRRPFVAVWLLLRAGGRGWRFRFYGLGRTGGLFREPRAGMCRLGDAVAAVSAVGLWDVTIVHDALPTFHSLIAPEPIRVVAIRAILAARMAFSSFVIRSRVR